MLALVALHGRMSRWGNHAVNSLDVDSLKVQHSLDEAIRSGLFNHPFTLCEKREKGERERKKEGEGLSLAPGEPSTLCVAAWLCSAAGLARGRAWRLQPGRLQLSFYALFLCVSAQQRSKCGCKAKQMSICCSAFLVIWWITMQPQRWICSMHFSPRSRRLHPRRCTAAVLGGHCSKCGCW